MDFYFADPSKTAKDVPTEKQLTLIKSISDQIGIPFQGKTKHDATKWISRYKPVFEKGRR